MTDRRGVPRIIEWKMVEWLAGNVASHRIVECWNANSRTVLDYFAFKVYPL